MPTRRMSQWGPTPICVLLAALLLVAFLSASLPVQGQALFSWPQGTWTYAVSRGPNGAPFGTLVLTSKPEQNGGGTLTWTTTVQQIFEGATMTRTTQGSLTAAGVPLGVTDLSLSIQEGDIPRTLTWSILGATGTLTRQGSGVSATEVYGIPGGVVWATPDWIPGLTLWSALGNWPVNLSPGTVLNTESAQTLVGVWTPEGPVTLACGGSLVNTQAYRLNLPGEIMRVWVNPTDRTIVQVETGDGNCIHWAPDGNVNITPLDRWSGLHQQVQALPSSASRVEAQVVASGWSADPLRLGFSLQNLTQLWQGDPPAEGNGYFSALGNLQIATTGFDASSSATFPLTPQAADSRWAAPEWGIQSSDPDLVSQARELVKGQSGAWAATQTLSTWVGQSIRPQEGLFSDARRTFLYHTGGMRDRAWLLVAMLRAVGIPARPVSGIIYREGPGYFLAPGDWVEVYLGSDGWVALEAGSMDSKFSALHLGLGPRVSLDGFEVTLKDASP